MSPLRLSFVHFYGCEKISQPCKKGAEGQAIPEAPAVGESIIASPLLATGLNPTGAMWHSRRQT
jgi:hypothetical protein